MQKKIYIYICNFNNSNLWNRNKCCKRLYRHYLISSIEINNLHIYKSLFWYSWLWVFSLEWLDSDFVLILIRTSFINPCSSTLFCFYNFCLPHQDTLDLLCSWISANVVISEHIIYACDTRDIGLPDTHPSQVSAQTYFVQDASPSGRKMWVTFIWVAVITYTGIYLI